MQPKTPFRRWAVQLGTGSGTCGDWNDRGTELRNKPALDPDMLAVFVDESTRCAMAITASRLYLLAIGLGRDGKKRVLSCIASPAVKISKTGKQSFGV